MKINLNFKIKNSSQGFTLVETIVGMCVGLMVLTFATMTLISASDTANTLTSKSDALTETRSAFAIMVKEIKGARSLGKCIKSRYRNVNLATITDINQCGETGETGDIVYFADKTHFCFYTYTTSGNLGGPDITCIGVGGPLPSGFSNPASGNPFPGSGADASTKLWLTRFKQSGGSYIAKFIDNADDALDRYVPSARSWSMEKPRVIATLSGNTNSKFIYYLENDASQYTGLNTEIKKRSLRYIEFYINIPYRDNKGRTQYFDYTQLMSIRGAGSAEVSEK